jgi:glutamate/aspartate transport system substrate-binding protein
MVLAQKQNTAEGLGLTILQGRDHAESLLMLRTGRAAAWYEDEVLLAGARSTVPDPAALVYLPAAAHTDNEDGLMLRRDDPDFNALVEGTLRAEMASGAFESLYDKWLLSSILPKGLNLDLPMSDVLQIRIKEPSRARAR